MREVVYEDKDGWKHRALVRDGDPDDAAPGGIPRDPPDMRMLDFEGIARDINNRLIDLGITSWMDWQRAGNINNVIASPLKRRVVMLLRGQEEHHE